MAPAQEEGPTPKAPTLLGFPSDTETLVSELDLGTPTEPTTSWSPPPPQPPKPAPNKVRVQNPF